MSAEQTPRPRLGLVLGGGGARGLAHIGVLRVLERERIPVACVAGTSMGGLIGALYAAGVAIERVEAEVVRLSRVTEQMRLVDFELSAAGLSVRGRRIYNMLAELLGEELTFADLRLPLAMVSVDVRTGRPVTLQGGLVIDAVRATISIPGIFTPVDLGDYRLVDGGVLDNVPVDVAHALGATHTVAVDVLPSYSRNQPRRHIPLARNIPNIQMPLKRKRIDLQTRHQCRLTQRRRNRQNPRRRSPRDAPAYRRGQADIELSPQQQKKGQQPTHGRRTIQKPPDFPQTFSSKRDGLRNSQKESGGCLAARADTFSRRVC